MILNIQHCFEQLATKRNSHPHLCSMWERYLLCNKPSKNDLYMCSKAVKHMDTLPDITPQQAYVMYSMLSLFFNK